MLIWGFFVVGEELMLLGLISLLLGHWARWISEICVDSSLFSGRFYPCSEDDFSVEDISGTGCSLLIRQVLRKQAVRLFPMVVARLDMLPTVFVLPFMIVNWALMGSVCFELFLL